MIKLGYTSQATPKECEDGRLLHPICVCKDGVACTIRARYNALGTAQGHPLAGALPKDRGAEEIRPADKILKRDNYGKD